MKKLLFCMIVVLGMTSCVNDTKSYSYEEMQTFIALRQATPTKDSLTITLRAKNYRLPIVSIDNVGFYPAESNGGVIRYYKAKKQ